MGRSFQTRLLVGIVAFCFAITANAKIIRYTLDNVTFADGGTASGYFEWDTSLLNLVSEYQGASVNYDVSVSGGGAGFPTFNYLSGSSGPMGRGGSVGGKRILEIGDGSRKLGFIPDTDFGIIGIDLNIPLLVSPANAFELVNPPFAIRSITGGSLVGTDVSPVPTATPVPTLPFYVLLALTGLIGLFGLRKLTK